jgi:anaerobic selenocysteine-containing dehydrogenase
MRSNNSWMHNLWPLVKGPKRCTAMINPADAARLGIAENDEVRLRSRVGDITLPARLTDEVGMGTVCVPHGWSEPMDGSRLTLAHALQSANYNRLSDDAAFDVPSGCASFNGTPISVERVGSAKTA